MHFNLADYKEYIQFDSSLEEIKQVLSKAESETIVIKWVDAEHFVLSLKTSIGTNYLFSDLHQNRKSDVYANGVLIKESDKEALCILTFKEEKTLYLILLLPIVILISAWLNDIIYLLLFAVIPILGFFIFRYLKKLERRRLIISFKKLFKQSTHYNNA